MKIVKMAELTEEKSRENSADDYAIYLEKWDAQLLVDSPTKEVELDEEESEEKIIRNAFNTRSIGTDMVCPDPRNAETITADAPRDVMTGNTSAAIIYQTYLQDHENLEKTGYRQAKPAQIVPRKELSKEITMERVFAAKELAEIADDFRNFEDPADPIRNEGRLLPLWQYRLPDKNMPVTDIQWNPEFQDLLAVTMGDYELNARSRGAFVLHSLKNPFHPEWLMETQWPAMCVSLHPQRAHLAVVGFSVGNVAVFDTSAPSDQPGIWSDFVNKHSSSVLAVRWKEDQSGLLSFFSISQDGLVKSWDILSTGLTALVIRNIKMAWAGLQTGISQYLDGGKCFTFYPHDDSNYLIGSYNGWIYKSSTDQANDSVHQFKAHVLSVSGLDINTFEPSLFLSCSSDWCIKLWEAEKIAPLAQFRKAVQVTAVKWAPYTSTVFAAATVDGNIHIYDLHLDLHNALHMQKVVSSLEGCQPTQIVFNALCPVLAVGDTHGKVRLLKLSPYLRVPAKAAKKESIEQRELEVRKLKKALALMKQGESLAPPDVSCIPN